MIKFDLPGCGFGFWYLLGMYHNMKRYGEDSDIFLSGKSGGAIVCFLSLLEPEYQEFDFLIGVCEKLHEIEKKYCVINLHNYVYHFLIALLPYLNESELEERFGRMEIIITKVHTIAKCVPYRFSATVHTPKNIDHMVNLVCASCFVPMMSRKDMNPCCYTLEHEWMIDGAFLDIFLKPKNAKNAYKIRSEHSKFTIPSKNECIEMYYNGYLNTHQNPPNDMVRIQIAFDKIPSVFPSYALLLDYIEHAEIPLVLTDEHGLVDQVNKKWSNFCGYTLEELKGKTLGVLQGDETDKSTMKRINSNLRRHIEVDEIVVNYKNSKEFQHNRFLNHVVIKPVYIPKDKTQQLSKIDDDGELECYFISWADEVNKNLSI